MVEEQHHTITEKDAVQLKCAAAVCSRRRVSLFPSDIVPLWKWINYINNIASCTCPCMYWQEKETHTVQMIHTRETFWDKTTTQILSHVDPWPAFHCVYVCACVCICVHVCACVCLCVFVCACVCVSVMKKTMLAVSLHNLPVLSFTAMPKVQQTKFTIQRKAVHLHGLLISVQTLRANSTRTPESK